MADKNTKPSIDYQKELKDLYDTGTTDRQVDAAKQKQKEAATPVPAKAPPVKYAPSKEISKFNDNYKKGGKVSSASSRADGIATKGKTKGRYI